MTYPLPADLDAVAAASKQAPGRGLPPVHLWRPAHCGEIDIVIKANGQWMHEGSPIGREALVRLFSTVLRLDPDGYHLVTPGEKMRITVEDAPFVALSVERRDDALWFVTNVGDEVRLDAEHPLRVDTDDTTGEPRPYVMVRAGLEALIMRPVFYDLVDMAEERSVEPILSFRLKGKTEDGLVLAVRSAGSWFTLGPVEALGS